MLTFFLVGGRQYAEFGLKVPGKVFGVIEPYFVGDLGHSELVLFQELGGSFQPNAADELDGGLSRERKHFFV
jgi:hypothetical protein